MSLGALVRRIAIPSRDSPMHVRGIRHLIANGSGTVMYILMVAAFVESSLLPPVVAVVVSFGVFVIYTYLVNRLWVHAATSAHGRAVPRFAVAMLVALGLNAGIMWLTVDVLHLQYYWALAIATLVVPPTNFLLNYLWVFRT